MDEKSELMTIQSNNVTFGKYDISSIQENILTTIGGALQNHMTNKASMSHDLFNVPYIEVNCDEIGGKNNKRRVLKEAKDLMKRDFSFRWSYPNNGQAVETTGVIITTIHDLKGTNILRINLNEWAIPFLIYYGKGVGGTLFSKEIALGLRGKYAKRIYKIICSQRNRTRFEYDIKQIRRDFEVPANYDNAHLRSKILEPARKAINESHSDVTFEYELIAKKRNHKTKPVADTIVLHITPKYIALPTTDALKVERQKDYQYAYNWIKLVSGIQDDPAIISGVDQLQQEGGLKAFVKKCQYYDDQLVSGKCTKLYVRNTLAKILREDHGILVTVHKV